MDVFRGVSRIAPAVKSRNTSRAVFRGVSMIV